MLYLTRSSAMRWMPVFSMASVRASAREGDHGVRSEGVVRVSMASANSADPPGHALPMPEPRLRAGDLSIIHRQPHSPTAPQCRRTPRTVQPNLTCEPVTKGDGQNVAVHVLRARLVRDDRIVPRLQGCEWNGSYMGNQTVTTMVPQGTPVPHVSELQPATPASLPAATPRQQHSQWDACAPEGQRWLDAAQ